MCPYHFEKDITFLLNGINTIPSICYVNVRNLSTIALRHFTRDFLISYNHIFFSPYFINCYEYLRA